MTVFNPGDRVHMWVNSHTTGTVTRSAPDGRVFVQWDDTWAVTSNLPQHLELVGEPMSTADFFAEPGSHHHTPHERTFASLTACDSALTIGTNSQGILVGIKRGGKTVQATTVAFTDAPDGAIAFLQSAVPTGQQIPAEFARAMEALEEYKQRIQAEAEAAADREALEFEALELLNAAREADDNPLLDSLDETRPGTKERWIATAKCARVLHGVTK